jgi:Glycoside Hydrolase Family 113
MHANRVNGGRQSKGTRGLRRWWNLAMALTIFAGALAWSDARSEPADGQRLDGFNVIQTPGYPFGSASARLALANAKRLGARAIAVVPFLWQASPASANLVRGKDMTDAQLRAAIRDAHALGLAVLVKPHVWVPQHWAGAIAMNSTGAWGNWFANYRRQLNDIARIAEQEKADSLAIGTELAGTSQRPEWTELIADARKFYSGRLLYVAHNVEEAEAVPFWDRLDAVGVTLYPPLGTDDDRDGRLRAMRAVADRLDALSVRTGKSIIVGEVGLRSAPGAAAEPWQSAEERVATPDPSLQAAVLADWLKILDRPSIRGVLIWRWFTDPNAGGLSDTDFTVQGKPAEQVLMCAWTAKCQQDQAGIRSH